jgi:hypothetical protein
VKRLLKGQKALDDPQDKVDLLIEATWDFAKMGG